MVVVWWNLRTSVHGKLNEAIILKQTMQQMNTSMNLRFSIIRHESKWTPLRYLKYLTHVS